MVIGCVYRPPQGNILTFIDAFQNILEKIKDRECYICGDFNVNLGIRNAQAKHFLNTLFTRSLRLQLLPGY